MLVPLPTGRTVVRLAHTARLTTALLDDGSVWVWGLNMGAFASLPDGALAPTQLVGPEENVLDVAVSLGGVYLVKRDGTVLSSTMYTGGVLIASLARADGLILMSLPGGAKVASVVPTSKFVLVTDTTGHIWGWD